MDSPRPRRPLPATAAALLMMLFWVGQARAGTMQPEAVAILERMFKTYATAAAFACEGSCDDRQEGSPLPPDHRTMTVRFARPDRFRLDWVQKDFHGQRSTSVIYTERGRVFLREGGAKETEPEPSLAQAINSCAGISLGLSYLVPALLLNDPGYLTFVELQQETDANSEDGRPCWKLSGKTTDGARWELLIDRETCALREAVETNALASADNAPPPHPIHTRYRFTNIRFADSLPDSAFADAAPSDRKKR